MTSNLTAMDVQSRVCTETIDKAEKYLGVMCEKMSSANRKNAKIRDRGDELAHGCVEYAVKELPSMQAGLDAFGKHLSDVQDYRQAYIDQIDQKVIHVLTDYGQKCKDAKRDLKKFESDRNKERKKIDSRNKAKTTQQLAQSQNELARLTDSVKRSTKLLEESILKFEEKRLADLKHIMMEYCRIEMTFAAKCLEQFSSCYQNLAKVSTAEDMIVFQQSLQPYKLTERLGVNPGGTPISQQLQTTSPAQPQLLPPPSANSSLPQQYSSAPVSEINRSQATLQSQSAVQSFQNGHENQEESEYETEDEETSEYESEEEEEEPVAVSSRPSTVRTGWQ